MKKISRRNFVKGATAIGAFMILPSCMSAKKVYANGRVNVAVIGAGGRGSASVNAIAKSPKANLVALCDVDDANAAAIYKKYPDVKKYYDFRKMLDEMPEIDAVVVATPDHMHYPISAWAMKMGKHVYCEKPLTRTVWESRQMARLAKRYGVKTQMGNQGHTQDGWRALKELIDAGVLGQIEDVYSWTDRPNLWPQGNLPLPAADRIPSTLKYDLWLGVAPKVQYFKKMLPFNWRGLRLFGTGASGDMACHITDAAYSSMNLTTPYKVESTQEGMNDSFWPAKSTSHLYFKNKLGANGEIRLHWYDGAPGLNKPAEVKRVAHEYLHDPRLSNGTFVVGTKETVFLDVYGGNAVIQPLARMREFMKNKKLPPKTLPRSKYVNNPWDEWLEAILAGGEEQSPANFSYAAPLTELSLLNLCGIQAGFPLEYNGDKMEFTNAPEMNKYLHSLYDYDKSFIL